MDDAGAEGSVGYPQKRKELAVTTQQVLKVGPQSIRVAVRPGSGVPLVLCNGIGSSLEVFEPLIDSLRPDIPVVSFDVPGTGQSPKSRLPYVHPHLAWMLGRILTRLEMSRVDILGLSWGGMLAQQFAFQNPRRCRRVVLVSTATGAMAVPARPTVLAKMLTPKRFRNPRHTEAVASAIYGGSVRTDTAPVMALLGRQSALGSRRGYQHQLLAGSMWTSLPLLWALRQDTLIIAGTDDPIIPAVNARVMNRLLPNATLHLHRGGHLDPLLDVDTFGPLISDFVRP